MANNIVDLLMDAVVTAIDNANIVDNVGRGPFAEQMEPVGDNESAAVIFPNDPDDPDGWVHEINRNDLQIGTVFITHRPFFRRFTLQVRKNYENTTRDAVVGDFGDIMRALESLYYRWSTVVGPDAYGETASRHCTQGCYMKSWEKVSGGETDFQARGKLWVEFRTT